MKRFALLLVIAVAALIELGAMSAPAGADPLPAGVQCPATIGADALSRSDATFSSAQQSHTVTCQYGTDGASFQVTYGDPNGTFAIGCEWRDDRSDITVGNSFNPTGALAGDHFGGTVEDGAHAISTTWTTTVQTDAGTAKAGALEVAAAVIPLTRRCDATPAAGTAASTHTTKRPTGAAVALLGGGLLTTAGGLLTRVRLGRRAAGASAPAPIDDRLVSGTDAIDVLLHAGLVQTVTRPDGSVGYKPIGELEQFDHLPQWRVPLTGQPNVDGRQYHDIAALSYHEHPDGTFDSATIVVGVQAAPQPPPTPTPAPEPTPAGAEVADSLARELFIEHMEETSSWYPGSGPLVQSPPPPPVTPSPQPPTGNRDAWEHAHAQRDAGIAEHQQQLDAEKFWGWLETGTSGLHWIADRSIDVLAKMTGPAGTLVKDVYTVTNDIGKGIGEAMATGDTTKIAKGAADGVFDLAWGKGVDRLQALNKIPGFRPDSPVLPGGTATRIVRQVVDAGSPTRAIPRSMGLPDAARSGFRSWLRDSFVRDPVKHQLGL